MHSYASPGRVITIANSGPGAVPVRGDQPYRLRGLVGVTQGPADVDDALNLCVEGEYLLPVVLADGVDAVEAGGPVYMRLDGTWQLVAGGEGAIDLAPFAFLVERVTRDRLALLKLGAVAAASIMVGVPSGFDYTTGKIGEGPVPADEGQLLVSTVDGVVYHRETVVVPDAMIPPDYEPFELIYRAWRPINPRFLLYMQQPQGGYVQQAANPDGAAVMHYTDYPDTDYHNGVRILADCIEFVEGAGAFEMMVAADLFTEPAAGDRLEIWLAKSFDGGQTFPPGELVGGASPIGTFLHVETTEMSVQSFPGHVAVGRISLVYRCADATNIQFRMIRLREV